MTLQQKQRKFLDETVNFYNLNNRCTVYNSHMCRYSATRTSPGCALGRHIPKELANKLDSFDESPVSENKIFDLLPQELQELEQEFLTEVQRLHDKEINWTEEGLSHIGKDRYNKIISEFKLDQYVV